MSKMYIYEPAMCCSTGLCGGSSDSELIRISTAISNLEKKGIQIQRIDFAADTMEFINSKEINELITKQGVEILPVTVVNGVIVKTKAYPSNEEIASIFQISVSDLTQKELDKPEGSDECGCGCGCGCGGGCC